MMAIKVRFFAALRERLGVESMEISSAARFDLDGLLEVIGRRLGDHAIAVLRAPNVRIAINREFVTGECVVNDGDEIAFMPPITGG